jgi:hypothetical protein
MGLTLQTTSIYTESQVLRLAVTRSSIRCIIDGSLVTTIGDLTYLETRAIGFVIVQSGEDKIRADPLAAQIFRLNAGGATSRIRYIYRKPVEAVHLLFRLPAGTAITGEACGLPLIPLSLLMLR